MLVNGNHTPERCAQNLLNSTQGDCPMNYEKGLDPELIDRNSPETWHLLITQARKMIETFEPRLSVNRVNLVPDRDHGTVNVEVSRWKEGE